MNRRARRPRPSRWGRFANEGRACPRAGAAARSEDVEPVTVTAYVNYRLRRRPGIWKAWRRLEDGTWLFISTADGREFVAPPEDVKEPA